MRIVITGGQGQLGLELERQLKGIESMQVYSFSRESLDIMSGKQVQEVLHTLKPQVVINCAAYTAVDLCEEDQEKAYEVNAMGPYHLAVACEQIGAKLVQVSTDYVFSGNFNVKAHLDEKSSTVLEARLKMAKASDPWTEEDPVAPQNVYGVTKLKGEEFVRMHCKKHFILRTAWLYGEGNNFVRTMLKLAQTNAELNVVGDQFGSPTYTKDLATAIIKLMQTEHYGTYHGTCEGQCSWYDFANEIFKLKEIDVKVNKVTSEQFVRPAKRPKYSVLENANLKKLGLNTFRSWQEALEDYLEQDKNWQEANLGGQN